MVLVRIAATKQKLKSFFVRMKRDIQKPAKIVIMKMNKDLRCMEIGFQCERTIVGVCGGVLYPEGSGCGRPFCGEHLIGKLGPYYCRTCWDARKIGMKPTIIYKDEKKNSLPDLELSITALRNVFDEGIGQTYPEDTLRRRLGLLKSDETEKLIKLERDFIDILVEMDALISTRAAIENDLWP
jgi:hypothetical protein